jgi:nucleotide-binding universal stress UspA family protein
MTRRDQSGLALVAVVAAGRVAEEVAVRRRQAANYLQNIRGKFELPVCAETTVRIGDPAAEILSEARDSGADLILMPDRSDGGRPSGDLGRVTSRILLGSPTPVLIVRRDHATADADHNVMVMLDGSRLAEEALRPAAELAARCSGRLTLVTVLARASGQFGDTPARWSATDLDAELALRYLERLAEPLAAKDLPVAVDVVTDEVAAFLRHINRPSSTILVLTTRGASGFSRWVMGGVADLAARSATAATMVVPPRMT